jgi:hypothetical protein
VALAKFKQKQAKRPAISSGPGISGFRAEAKRRLVAKATN